MPKGSRRYHLPTITAQGAAASRDWYLAQPPEQQAYIVSRMVAAWMRAAAIRRGQPSPIIFEAETRPDYMSLTVDPEKIQPTDPPDPRVYRALPGGGYIYIPAEEQWNHDTAAIRRRARNTRRRARRAERKAAKAAESPKPPGESG